MTTPDPKTVTPEELAAKIFTSFFGGPSAPSAQDKPKTAAPPTPDPIVETQRLLAKAEKSATGSINETELLIQIADRQLRLVETALAYQR